jgi:hypothetical protein
MKIDEGKLVHIKNNGLFFYLVLFVDSIMEVTLVKIILRLFSKKLFYLPNQQQLHGRELL